MNKFRTLRADEIECRVGTCNEKGFSLLLYKDARCDQNILDETVGLTNWQRDHKEVKGNLYCGVSIWDEQKTQWITKWDCGVESNTEKEKGEASDSFKRACFNWGIGRELYTAPFIYVKGNVKSVPSRSGERWIPTFKTMDVTAIEYKDGKISKLVITGDGQVIYGNGGARGSQTQNNERKPQNEQSNATKSEITLNEAYELKTAKGKYFNELTEEQLQYIVDNSKNATAVQGAKLILEDRRNNPDFEPIDEDGLPF